MIIVTIKNFEIASITMKKCTMKYVTLKIYTMKVVYDKIIQYIVQEKNDVIMSLRSYCF
jgi:hypothetical protein